jgi:hypothetical protein
MPLTIALSSDVIRPYLLGKHQLDRVLNNLVLTATIALKWLSHATPMLVEGIHSANYHAQVRPGLAVWM